MIAQCLHWKRWESLLPFPFSHYTGPWHPSSVPPFSYWESWNPLAIPQRGIIYSPVIKSLLNFPRISWNLNNGGKCGTHSQGKWTKCFSTSCVSMEKLQSLLMQSKCWRKRETLNTSSLPWTHLCELSLGDHSCISLILQEHRQCPTPFREGKSSSLLTTHQERTWIPAGMLRTN